MNKEELIKVAILGGTGEVGHFLVQKASEAGYQTRILVRNPDKIQPNDERGRGPTLNSGQRLFD